MTSGAIELGLDSGNWATTFATSQSIYGQGIAGFSDGSSVLTGYFNGTSRFHDKRITSSGASDIYVVKLEKDGAVEWVTQAGGPSWDQAEGVTTYSDGSSIIIGTFRRTATFGDTNLTYYGSNDAYADIFISKINSEGQFEWTKSIGSVGHDEGLAVSPLPDGSAIITGSFTAATTFGTEQLTPNGNYADIFISKINSDGTFAWTKRAGGASNDSGFSISTLDDGSSIVTGSFKGTADFGSITLDSSGIDDIFIAKLDASGNFLWAKQAGGASTDQSLDIEVLDDGTSVITGFFTGQASFDGTILNAHGNSDQDIFVAQYSPDGDIEWAKSFGSSSSDQGRSITKKSDQSIVFAGSVGSSTNIGEFALNSPGGFAATINHDGDIKHADQPITTGVSTVNSITLLPVNSLIALGEYNGAIEFEGGEILDSGAKDNVFVLQQKYTEKPLVSFSANGFLDSTSYKYVVPEAPAPATIPDRTDGIVDFNSGNYFSFKLSPLDVDGSRIDLSFDSDPNLDIKFKLQLDSSSFPANQQLSSGDITLSVVAPDYTLSSEEPFSHLINLSPDSQGFYSWPVLDHSATTGDWILPELFIDAFAIDDGIAEPIESANLIITNLIGADFSVDNFYTPQNSQPFSVQDADSIIGSFNLDVDGDGRVEAFSDGLMVVRKLLGSSFSDNKLTDKAMTMGATRSTTEIHNFIQQGIDDLSLDLDKDGRVTAFSDGLMLIRSMLGTSFKEEEITENAISSNSPYYNDANAWESVQHNINNLYID